MPPALQKQRTTFVSRNPVQKSPAIALFLLMLPKCGGTSFRKYKYEAAFHNHFLYKEGEKVKNRSRQDLEPDMLDEAPRMHANL